MKFLLKNNEQTKKDISELGCSAELRVEDNTLPFVTDNKNYIYHCKFEKGIDNPKELDKELMKIEGVVDTGLFIDMTTKVIVGNPDGIKIID